MSRNLISFLKSPSFLSVLFGMIVFLLYSLLKEEPKEEIVITQQTIDALVQQNQELSPVPLSKTEVDNIIQGYIDDEVLIREARKIGIDKNDGRIRKQMLQVMRTSITDRIPDPTYAQLQAFYEESVDRYTSDSSRSFVFVYYEFTNEDIPDLNQEAIKIFNSSENLSSVGDYSAIGNRFPEYTFGQVSAAFGRSFAEAVFTAEIDQWLGPIESTYGIHFVYVFGIHEPKVAKFEEVESYLAQDYLFQKMRESQQEKIDKLKENYQIVIQ